MRKEKKRVLNVKNIKHGIFYLENSLPFTQQNKTNRLYNKKNKTNKLPLYTREKDIKVFFIEGKDNLSCYIILHGENLKKYIYLLKLMEYLKYNHIFNIVKYIENKFMNKLTTFKLITYKNMMSTINMI